jgi:hypothetical protein
MMEVGLKHVNTHERILLWKTAVDYIGREPLTGIGPMHYAYEKNVHAHPHNGPLQIASEYGLIIFLSFLFVLINFLIRWISSTFRLASRMSKANELARRAIDYRLLLFFSLISGLAYSMVSGVFVMPMPQTMMAIIFGFSVGTLISEENSSINLLSSILIQIACGLTLIFLTIVITPHLSTRVLNPFYATFIPKTVSGPRYWELGGLQQSPSNIQPFYYEHPALNASDLR